MEIVGPSSEVAMIATFLRAEIASPRHGAALLTLLAHDGVDRATIDTPELADDAANVYRRALLGAFRGYGQDRELFVGFPLRMRWQRATLTQAELATVRYIAYDYWIALSGGTRLAPEAARRIRAGETIYGVANEGFWQLADLWAARAPFPELIFVASGSAAPLVLLEGHARLTAYFLRLERMPAPLTAIVGFAPDLPSWSLY